MLPARYLFDYLKPRFIQNRKVNQIFPFTEHTLSHSDRREVTRDDSAVRLHRRASEGAASDWIPATVLLREMRARGYPGGYGISWSSGYP